MIDRQHLTVLREIQRQGSVTAAAERLGVTQSALSHMISKLEDHYAIKVWMKKGRGFRMTQAGEYLLEVAERLLPQLDHVERSLADFSLGRRGTLRIGMECHPCERWLAQVVTPYLSAWPDVDFEVLSAFRFDGIGALLGNEIDLLITPDPIEAPELRFVPVFDYELRLVVPENHRLALKQSVSAQDLLDETLITVPVSLERLDIYTKFFVPAHCRPRQHKTAETVELMLQLVCAGRGVAVLPDWILRDEHPGLPIRTVRLGRAGIEKKIYLGIRVGEEEIAYIAGFLALARKITQ